MSKSIPNHSGKISGLSLKSLPIFDLDLNHDSKFDVKGLFRQWEGGHCFEYLWSPKENAKYLFLLFSGDAMRSKYELPVFQRWSWAEHFPGHCLYVSDPMLHMDPNLGLAWYAGTPEIDPLKVIMKTLKVFLKAVGLDMESVCTYGSSGGGFAALRMAGLESKITAVAINPQTNIANYYKEAADRYAKICLEKKDRYDAVQNFPEKMDLNFYVQSLRLCNIILIQNTLDTYHYEKHYKPFCISMGTESSENLKEGRFRRLLFEHPDGHRRAEIPLVFDRAINIIENDFFV